MPARPSPDRSRPLAAPGGGTNCQPTHPSPTRARLAPGERPLSGFTRVEVGSVNHSVRFTRRSPVPFARMLLDTGRGALIGTVEIIPG
nr:hypothetical protein GCM10017544_30410 [Microbacterium imperiale]